MKSVSKGTTLDRGPKFIKETFLSANATYSLGLKHSPAHLHSPLGQVHPSLRSVDFNRFLIDLMDLRNPIVPSMFPTAIGLVVVA